MVFESASNLAKVGFVLISSSLMSLVFSIFMAKKRHFSIHFITISLAITTSITFLFMYVVRWMLEGDTKFSGNLVVRYFVYYPILFIHISLAIISIYFVGKQVVLSLKYLNFDSFMIPRFSADFRLEHRKLGRIAYKIWGASFSGGIITFILLYL